ncbi:MAG: Capsular polysaccharide biosynthesis protein [Streptosporangiaceae bacterium]|nr:Capsular polysaccharide biosynthesis protein [Streptosporangiaceae bacterium]
MYPAQYLAAILRRWVWVLAAGTAGAGIGLLIVAQTPVTYSSTASLFVGVSHVDAAGHLGPSSQVANTLLPSLAELSHSAAVLQPVIDRLHLPTTPADLAADVDAQVLSATSLLQLTVTAPDPDGATTVATAVAEHLRTEGAALYADTQTANVKKSPLVIRIVARPVRPSAPAGPHTSRFVVVGLTIGLLAGAVSSGFLALAHPLVEDAGSVPDPGQGAVVEVVARTRTRRRRPSASFGRAQSVEALRWFLQSAGAARGPRIAVVGASRTADQLSRELGCAPGDGRTSFRLFNPRELRRGALTAGCDGLVLVARSGRSGRRWLQELLADARRTGVHVVAVVVDGVPAPDASRPARFLAALRGLPTPEWAHPASSGGRPGHLTAIAALVLLGMNQPLPGATSTGLIATVALVPVWAAAVARARGATVIFFLAVVGLLSGILLTVVSSVDHQVATRHGVELSFAVLTGLGGIGLVVWARTVLSMRVLGLAFGAGMLVAGALAPATVDVYKFQFALPVTIIVLSMLSDRAGRTALRATLLAFGVLAVLDVAGNARSAFGRCAIAAALLLWQMRKQSSSRRAGAGADLLLLAAVGVGVYFAATELLVSGALGAEVQARTTQQIAQSGSLLLGGRPEWLATLSLMTAHPFGFGIGAVPNAADVATAKAGIAVTHIPTINGYIEHYLFDGRFELHSVVADLWVNLGPAGLLLGLAMVIIIVGELVVLLSRRAAPALVCFAGVTALWYLAFGPVYSNMVDVAFAVGLLMSLRTRPIDGTDPGDDRVGTPGAATTLAPLPQLLHQPS